MLFIPNTALSGTATATGNKSRTPAEGQGEGFASLLALLQAGRQPQAATGTLALPRAIAMPGDAKSQRASMQGLLAQLQDLAGTTTAALQELTAIGGTQEAQEAILAQAAMQLGAMLQAFDNATGADSLQTLAANLASLQNSAQKLSEGDSGVELAQAMFGLAAGLLGLSNAAASPAAPAREPAGPLAGAGTIKAPAEPAQGRSAPAAPAFAERPAMQAEAFQPAPRQSAEGEAIAPGTDSHATGGTSAARSRAAELLSAALQAKPAATEAVPPPSLPQGAAELRPHAGTEAAAARSTAQPHPPAQPDGFARNLASQIRNASFSEGRTRIELAPRGLGSIEIDLQADEAGKLHVVLRAENPSVLSALRGDRAALLSVLGDSGVAVEESALDFESFGQQPRQQQEAAPLNPGPGGSAEDEPDTADPADPAPRPASGAGRLDIIT